MSRIGKQPIALPAGVTVTVGADNLVTVKGAKFTLSRKIASCIEVEVNENVVNVKAKDDTQETNAMHGLSRTLVANMVTGVSVGYKKELDVNGVGYRVAKQGNQLVLNVGFSHQVFVDERNDVTFEVPGPNKIIVSGPDKQAVGQLAAEIREVRPPEPYLGKGIKYADEVIRRKEGKTAAKKK
ncbi:MAG: 50S ribosomal protein L6 [Clostridia bacterium]|nr:50S ribosomal protein L6 [Clostridia bacterium]